MRIENQKLDFKDKAHSKVGSLSNAAHTPGGGNIMVNKKKILIYAHVGNPENIYSHKKKQHDSFTQSISNTNANITNHHCKTKSVLHPYSLF